MFSLDVSALFPSVPVDEALKIVEEKLELHSRPLRTVTTLSPKQVSELLSLCTDNTFVQASI